MNNSMKQFTAIAILLLIPIIGASQNTTWKKVTPCSFSLEIPVNMKIKKMYDDSSLARFVSISKDRRAITRFLLVEPIVKLECEKYLK